MRCVSPQEQNQTDCMALIIRTDGPVHKRNAICSHNYENWMKNGSQTVLYDKDVNSKSLSLYQMN